MSHRLDLYKKQIREPSLDAITITRLLGTKQIVRDGFFFTENQQASAKFGSIQIVIDCSIFNADDFHASEKTPRCTTCSTINQQNWNSTNTRKNKWSLLSCGF